MTARQLAWIFGVLGAMLGAWLLLRAGGRGADEERLDLSGRTGEGVSYVRIDPPGGEPLRLERRSKRWTVDGYPASDSLVEATLARLDTLAPRPLVARSAGSHRRLGLEDSTAVRVRIGPPDDLRLEFLVGGEGADGRFVRLPDAEPAYVFPADLMEPFARGESAWRDFTVIRTDTASLRRIVIRRRGAVAAELRRDTATPDGPAWTVDGARADSALMRAYLGTVAHLEGTGFPADSFVFAADFEDPLGSVELYDDLDPRRPPTASLLFSTGLDHPDVLVRRGDDPIVYSVDPRSATLLTLPADRLRAGGPKPERRGPSRSAEGP